MLIVSDNWAGNKKTLRAPFNNTVKCGMKFFIHSQTSTVQPQLCLQRAQCVMTSSNGNTFRVTGHLCGEFTGPRWIPRTHKGRWRGAFMLFDLRLNKRSSKQWWNWWFETPSHPLWRHCYVSRDYFAIPNITFIHRLTIAQSVHIVSLWRQRVECHGCSASYGPVTLVIMDRTTILVPSHSRQVTATHLKIGYP